MLMSRDSGNRLNENTSLANLAEMLSDIGRPQEGLDLLDSWSVDPTLDTGNMIAHHREARGAVLVGLGRFREAADLMALGVAEAPTRQYEISATRSLAMALEELGDLRGALDTYKRLFALVTEQISEQAQRAASVAAVRLETVQAQAQAAMLRMQTSDLRRTNEDLNRHSEDLRRQALEDPLTGLPNRRRLDQLLASDLRSCSLILVDVDHFKWVNDAHTHLVGDAVLRELGALLRGSCRDGDTAARFGGEEFALVMLGTSLEGVLATAERVRVACRITVGQRCLPGWRSPPASVWRWALRWTPASNCWRWLIAASSPPRNSAGTASSAPAEPRHDHEGKIIQALVAPGPQHWATQLTRKVTVKRTKSRPGAFSPKGEPSSA